jgi:alanine racemase
MTPSNLPVRLRLSSEALVANWRTMARASGNACAGAAIKANGYGLGARGVADQLAKAGCRDFFVAHWAEAAALTSVIPADQIYVLNGIGPQDVEIAKQIGAVPVLNSPEQVHLWKAAQGARCHVMLDSGINRLGIGLEQIASVDFTDMDVDIVMSHLASADENVPQNEQQLEIFLDGSVQISGRRRSFANSAGIQLGKSYHFELTRPGLALYGGVPRPDMKDVIVQVVFPQAEIMQIRNLPMGSKVGYNATYIAETEMTVATIAIGYADGYVRGLSNIGNCRLGDLVLPVIGRVSMDLVTIDVSKAPNLRPGDFVDVDFDLLRAANLSGLSQYELLTGLGQRANRQWV